MFVGAKSSTIQRVFTRSCKPLTISSVCIFFLCFCLFLNCFSLLFLLFFSSFSFSYCFSLSFSFSFPFSFIFIFSFFIVSFVFSFGWCCLVFSLLGFVFLSFNVVLLGFFFFGWSLLFGCVAFHPLQWVVVRFPCLLLGGAAWFPPSFWVVLLFFLLLLVGCSFITSFFVPSLGGVAFPLLLRGAAWCLPPFGGVAVFPFPVRWGSLPPPPLGWDAFSPVFCWVVLLGFLLAFRWCCCFSFSCLVVLPSFSSFGWGHFITRLQLGGVVWFPPSLWVVLLFFLLLLGGAAWSPPSLALFSSPFTWCCLVSSLFGWSLLFGGAAFHHLHWVVARFPCLLLGGAAWSPPSFWVVLLFFLLLLVGCSFITSSFVPSLSGVAFPLLLRGAAWSPPPFGGVAVFPFPVWWCCLPSPPLGGTALSPVFCWVVLLGILLPWRCFPLLLRGAAWFSSLFGWSLLFGGAAFLLLLWVGLLHPPSSVGWCCLVSSFLGVVFLSFYVVLLGFLRSLGGLSCLVVLLSFSSFGWGSPYKGGEGRQHHQTGEGRTATPPKGGGDQATPPNRRRGIKQPHPKEEEEDNSHTKVEK